MLQCIILKCYINWLQILIIIVIQSEDDIKGHTRQVAVSNIPQSTTATGGLPTTLTLTKGAKVMLTVNADVCDGLVNGARGISGIIKNSDKVLTILVKFHDEEQLYKTVHIN